MRFVGYLLCFTLTFHFSNPISAQFITASEVERWVTPDFPSSDFNLNSAYVYLLNGEKLREVFEGEGLNRSEKKDLGIKKGDYPQYMYLAVSIPDPYKEGNEFTVPLMIHNVQDPNNISQVAGYGGRLLENIPDEVLKQGDMVGKVKFEAFKGNSSSEFWQRTAKIGLELGKTATSLLAAPLTGNFLALTQQIVPQVAQGISSLEKVKPPQAGQRMTSEFYIRLLSKELSNLFQERVVSATLYRIHWDIEGRPAQSRFFRNARPQRVEDLKDKVNHTSTPFILIVHTKSEYNTDHSELVYNQSYIEKKTRDYRKIQNSTKKEIEKQFLETLKLSVELKNQIGIFQNSLNTKYPDWLAYSKIIDLYYDIRTLQREELRKIEPMTDVTVREKYVNLYRNVQTDIDLWFPSELLSKGREIASFLVGLRADSDFSGYPSAAALYEDIELLDFFRDRVKQTEIQGKLPKEIESLETYTLTTKVLARLESLLFQQQFSVPESWSIAEKKQWFLSRAANDYPKCRSCAQRVGERINELENLTHEQNIQKYRDISKEYYEKLECYEYVYTELDRFIQANTDSLTISPLILEGLKKDRDDLNKLGESYSELVGRDYLAMKPDELSELLSRYYVNREKLGIIYERLKGVIFGEEVGVCE